MNYKVDSVVKYYSDDGIQQGKISSYDSESIPPAYWIHRFTGGFPLIEEVTEESIIKPSIKELIKL